MPIDRSVQLPSGGTLQESITQGQEQARALLGQSGAAALIWGSVLEYGAHSALQLRWAVARGETGPTTPSGRYQPDADLNLPPLFWEDLTKIVGLIVQTRLDVFFAERGTYQASKLKPFIADTKQLLSSQHAQWQPMDRASVEFGLAYALQTFGEQAGDNSSLLEAIQRYRSVLNVRTRERVPLDWAGTQNNLGNALRGLGERESGTQHLQEAVVAFEQALEVFRAARATHDVVVTERNLALTRAILQTKQV